jgi:hypothetical protein
MIKIEFPKNAFATMHPSAGGSAGGLFYIVEIEMHDDFERSRPGMTIRTGSELQAARRAAAERFQAIAMRYVPEGYTVEYRKSLSGTLRPAQADPSATSGHAPVALILPARVRPCSPAPGPKAQGSRPRDGGGEVGA